ncbi:MAG: family 43 glycosylhydrolase, partial [Planctomycetaceae bacterium]|nr:family 43 glycosylhydrolase [Planctomycetaceae bacterium]
MKITFAFFFSLIFAFVLDIAVFAQVPLVYPTPENVKWITNPSIDVIANPKMKWADDSRKKDTDGKPVPFSKDPTVIKFQGRYLMYFSLPPITGDKSGVGWIIGIAESKDLVQWKTIAALPPFQDCDRKGHCAPCARVWNNRVYMFYQSYGTFADDGICLAWSDNGIDFTPHSQNPIFKPRGDWTNTRAIDADAYIFKGKLFLYGSTRDAKGVYQKTVVATADPEGLKDPENKLGRNAWTLAFDGAILEPQLPWET